jgi:hypothetical protein
VNELLTIVTKDLDLYIGERRKTVILVYTTLSKLSVTTIELKELDHLLSDCTEDFNTKKDALKMVRVLNNMLTISREEKLANEFYLKEARKKRKPITDVIKTK